MIKFIVQLFLFLLLLGLAFFWLLSRANGYTDPFYVRFTTPKQSNLIIGTSRAAQGLQPRVFDSLINKTFFNYAFTIAHSPFGSTYYNSVKHKLKSNTKDGIFIIAVDPWSISSFTEDPNDTLSFREVNLSLGNTKLVNINPNPIYLLQNYNKKYYSIIKDDPGIVFLHNDGWLEVDYIMDPKIVEKNIEKKVKTYSEKNLPRANFSSIRYQYLLKTIHYLKQRGEVYLVRLPIHSKMLELENSLMPNFDETIQEAIKQSTAYLDLMDINDTFQYTDGNHLYKDSGKEVSIIIANWILNNNFTHTP